MKKNCLTCRYEPEWVSYLEKERGQHGECKFPISKCECEAVFVGKETIYRDRLNGHSPAIQGKEFECGAWAAKEDK